ncbi:MAG: glycosyltransferase family 2 protein [Muribaculaceae bacterium]|nr:glycosyltransferase family 2 protein [Muribaculaceae bacterium]
MPKVSVIVAVYNVEQYIERCARSLFEQTLDDIEYIFVNDCTPDNSMAVLKATLSDYPHRQSQVTIINNPENLKQAGARAIGMKAATGEYTIHCDPDDYVDSDMYETMYLKAVETDADVVTCGWIMHNGNNVNYSIMELKSTGKASLKSLEFSISLCDKLIKTRLISDNEIYPYPDINFGEDMNVTVRVLFYADKVVTLTDYYPYHYISTPDSATKMPGVEIFERYYSKCAERLVEFLTENGGEEYRVVCNYLKFYCKHPLLNSNKTRQWCETWIECHADIDKYPLPERYKRRMAWMAKHPIILAIYNRYFLMRYKWHQI